MTPADQRFGVYIHWPFCASKCPYCDFNSHVRAGGIDEARYLKAYLAEMAWTAARSPAGPATSVFIGGGTPSLASSATIGALIETVARQWGIAEGAEITIEANPSSVEAGRFRDYRSAGVNRASLGVQALDDAELRSLGRLHTVAEARAAIAVAARAFERTSFDLIYARPGQTAQAWAAELRGALALARGHLSLYQLTMEPGTPFTALHAAGKLRLPDDEAARELYLVTQELTGAAGLPAYEVSNHARAGEECRHNLLYWRYGPYAGIGPGAHGRVIVGGRRHATVAERNPERWLERVDSQGHGLVEDAALSREEEADEMLLMGLRLVDGFDLGRLAAHGVAPSVAAIDALVGDGLLMRKPGTRIVAATSSGLLVLNGIVAAISRSLVPVAAVS